MFLVASRLEAIATCYIQEVVVFVSCRRLPFAVEKQLVSSPQRPCQWEQMDPLHRGMLKGKTMSFCQPAEMQDAGLQDNGKTYFENPIGMASNN